MKALILSIGILFSMSAYADFNGSWTGTGHVKTQSFESDCTAMNVSLSQTQIALNETAYNYSCGAMNASFPKLNFQISGQDVSINGQKVGTITDTHLHLEFVDANKTKQTIDLEINGSSMTDTEVFTDTSGTVLMTVTGTLHKVSVGGVSSGENF